MRDISKKISILIFTFFMFFLLISCAEKTDEDLILEMMENIGRLAEKKDITSIMDYITDDYSDFQGRDRSKARDMIKNYFDDYRGIVIHVLSTQIDEINPPEAFIRTEIALSSGAAKVFRKLIRFSTDNYRLRLKLINRNSQWKIKHAEWRYISLNELFPESLSILKKIFPDT